MKYKITKREKTKHVTKGWGGVGKTAEEGSKD